MALRILCALLGSAQVIASPVEVVVSHFNEDVNWLADYATKHRIKVYTKGDGQLHKKVHPEVKVESLPNVGRESHTYLRHIVDNYEKLADWTVFTQAGEPTFGYRGHREGGGHLLAGDSFDQYLVPDQSGARFVYTAVVALPSMNHLLRAAYCINDMQVEGGHPTACPADASKWTKWWDVGPFHDFIANKIENQNGESVMDFYNKYINPSNKAKEVVISFPQGARFAVSRANILRHPKEVYQRILDTLSLDSDPYSGYFMEWMWSELFLGHQETCLIPQKTAAVTHASALLDLASRYGYAAPSRSLAVSGGPSGGPGVSGGSGISGGGGSNGSNKSSGSGTDTGGSNGPMNSSGSGSDMPAPKPDRPAATVVVTGSLSMTVSNPAAFVNDTAAVTGVKQALANLSSQPISQIAVNLSVVTTGGRRLASSMPRQLQSGAVKVDFAITASAASTAAATALGNSITGNIASVSPSDLSKSIQANVLAAGSNYSVTVQSVSATAVVTASDGSVVTTTTAATQSSSKSLASRISQSFTWVLLTGFALAATM